MFLPHPRVKVSIVESLRDREVACSASDRQGSNFESCVWRTVSSHHPQEVLLAQFSLYVHKGGLKPDSFYISTSAHRQLQTSFLREFADIGPTLAQSRKNNSVFPSHITDMIVLVLYFSHKLIQYCYIFLTKSCNIAILSWSDNAKNN